MKTGVHRRLASFTEVRAAQVVKAAAWDRRRLAGVGARLYGEALLLARLHLVGRRLKEAYPEYVSDAEREEQARRECAFRANLGTAAQRLDRAGLAAVLIKSGWETAGAGGDHPALAAEYGDFDLVVGRRHLAQAIDALSGWGVAEQAPRLEPHKVMVRPASGPSAHLHGEAEWFGVPVISASSLLIRSRPLALFPGLLLPSAADALRIWAAHAAFQNLGFLISELLEIRRLLASPVVTEAEEMAGREGWKAGFCDALAAAELAIARLDGGGDGPENLGPALPAALSLVDGWRHSAHLVGVRGWGEGARAATLRPALVLAKRRRHRG